MHSAALGGHANVVTLLAKEYNVDVMVRANGGITPMHSAAFGGHANVVTLLAKEYGVDVNVRNNTGATPMHYAAARGHVNVVTLLAKEYNVDVMVRNNTGAPPGAGSSSQYQTTTTSKKTKSRLFFCSREWARSNALCSQYQTTTTLARPLKGFSLCQARHQSPARHLIPRDYKGQTIYVCRAPADGKSVYWKQPLVCKTCHTIGKRRANVLSKELMSAASEGAQSSQTPKQPPPSIIINNVAYSVLF
jgi:hypothetical protein